MPKILFLAHRIPYPPNKGDKIRSFHLLQYLARRHPVYLGAFVDEPSDIRYGPVLSELCEETCLIRLRPAARTLVSLTGVFTGEALSLPYYRHRQMQAWVNRKIRKDRISHVIVYSSPMAQFVQHGWAARLRRIVDFVDVDSEKWRQYARRRRWPLQRLYAREGEKLLRFERSVAAGFDASVFVTAEEANLFRQLAPEIPKERITHVDNGVDTKFFCPTESYESPYGEDEPVLVFTGVMDYWANAEAVTWFAENIFPSVRVEIPHARFFIVGARPTSAVKKLEKIPGVRVTGSVPDIRPYLAHARAAVAPLRIARGLQNKVLEAMAMGKPVLATMAAMDGIRADPALNLLVSDDEAELKRLATELLAQGDLHGVGALGRSMVEKRYSWSKSLTGFEALL